MRGRLHLRIDVAPPAPHRLRLDPDHGPEIDSDIHRLVLRVLGAERSDRASPCVAVFDDRGYAVDNHVPQSAPRLVPTINDERNPWVLFDIADPA